MLAALLAAAVVPTLPAIPGQAHEGTGVGPLVDVELRMTGFTWGVDDWGWDGECYYYFQVLPRIDTSGVEHEGTPVTRVPSSSWFTCTDDAGEFEPQNDLWYSHRECWPVEPFHLLFQLWEDDGYWGDNEFAGPGDGWIGDPDAGVITALDALQADLLSRGSVKVNGVIASQVDPTWVYSGIFPYDEDHATTRTPAVVHFRVIVRLVDATGCGVEPPCDSPGIPPEECDPCEALPKGCPECPLPLPLCGGVDVCGGAPCVDPCDLGIPLDPVLQGLCGLLPGKADLDTGGLKPDDGGPERTLLGFGPPSPGGGE